MLFSTVLPSLFALASLAHSASASASPSLPTSLAPDAGNVTKRDFLGLCGLLGIGCDLSSDPSNCGRRGNVCGGNFLNMVAGSYVCNNGVCGVNCKGLFDFNWGTQQCQNVASDTKNCGSCGKVCSLTGATGTTCAQGNCLATSCAPGYTLSGGQCSVTINTATDPKNCGQKGNVCSSWWSNGSGATCENGQCRATACNALFDWDYSSKFCRPVASDPANCGRCGNTCSFPNGNGICSGGSCQLSTCKPNFYPVNGVCTSINLSSDPKNCGKVNNVCSFPLGGGVCSSGSCQYTSCASTPSNPLSLINGACIKVNTQTDTNNCGRVGNSCPGSFSNGGLSFCLNGVCQSTCNYLYAFDFVFGYCRPVGSDPNHCGGCGNVCNPTGSTSSKCSLGVCSATACATGYTLSNGACQKIDTNTNPQHCGGIGNCCTFTPAGAQGTCQWGTCVTTSCPSGYTLTSGACVKTVGPSQRARLVKKDLHDKRTLCPAGETACPIVGSASFDLAVTHHFSTAEQYSGVMAGSGGYECLDTKQSLDSCGGCASTGEGVDCTKIRGSVGVGCDAGSCVVFSCLAGWRPNMAGTECVRAHSEHLANSSTLAGSHAANGARRHLHSRHGVSHHKK